MWEFSRPKVNAEHPTMKPVAIIEYALGNSSKPGCTVFDNFLGSGSTLIACEMSKRVCRGLEIDPHYVSVIIQRWQDHTGKKAKKI